MSFRFLVGFIMGLVVCSCSQHTSKGEQGVEKESFRRLGSKSGLLFDHMGYRGTEYTDSMGTTFRLRHNPIIITNDSTVPIYIRLAFSEEYDYPMAYGNEKFRVFPLPKEWAANETSDSMYASMYEKLPKYIDKPFLEETIEPGEELIVAIGTLIPKPWENLSVVPNKLFAEGDGETFHTCDGVLHQDQSSNAEIKLGLKLDFTQSCIIIPCGEISYPER